MKKCPFCAEQIQDEAVKCRYCGSVLNGGAAGGATSEVVISHIHPSFKPIGALYILCALISAGGVFAVYHAGGEVLFVMPVVLGLFIFAAIFHFNRNKTSYVLSNQNLTVEQGVISKSATHIPLHKVQDVTVRLTLLDRIFNVGTLVVESAGSSGRVPEINVDAPQQVCAQILAQVNAARN